MLMASLLFEQRICFRQVWDKYASVFPAVWIASAFKGATGSDKYITDISKYELPIQLIRAMVFNLGYTKNIL
jgi:hypothetical protein